MIPAQQHTVATPDGRVLAVEEAGHPDGLPVLVHHGTPNSRHLYAPVVADAAARGLRISGYARPGHGGAPPPPGRPVADCAADVRAICAELGLERLVTWGISGGGPHVLAEFLAWSGHEGLAPGGEGWFEDGWAFCQPWGFDPATISVPLLVMHGREDKFVPFGHGQWLAAHIPAAQARLLDHDGHLTLMQNRVGEVQAWLAAQA